MLSILIITACRKPKDLTFRHRPIGLGLMGFQDVLYEQRIPYTRLKRWNLPIRCMEQISYYSILASCELAQERGVATKLSLVHSGAKGILPIDSIQLLKSYRGQYLEQDTSKTLDWDSLRETSKNQWNAQF